MKRIRIGKLLLVLPVAFLLLFAFAAPAGAFQAEGGRDMAIGAGQTVEGDYYIAAASFTLEGTIKGDLVVAAASVIVRGTVEGSLLGMAGSVTIEGKVNRAVRLIAGAVSLGENAQLAGDLVVGGGSLVTAPGSVVSGTLVFGGGQAQIAGQVGQDLNFAGSRLTLQGKVGRDANIVVGNETEQMPSTWWMGWIPYAPTMPSIAPGLVVAPGSSVSGTLSYSSPREYAIPPGVAGKVEFHQLEVKPGQGQEPTATQPPTFLDWLWNVFRHWVTLVVAGLILLWLFRGFLRRGGDAISKRPLPTLGWGVVWVIAIPVGLFLFVLLCGFLAVLLGLITFGELSGVVIGLAILALVVGGILLWLYLRYAASAVVGYALGRGILRLLTRKPDPSPAGSMILGLVILVLIFGIPVVGWILELIVGLFGLGALWLGTRDRKPTAFPPGGVSS